jgi:hypothetical protein
MAPSSLSWRGVWAKAARSRSSRCVKKNIKGHFRNLNWRYLPYIRPM